MSKQYLRYWSRTKFKSNLKLGMFILWHSEELWMKKQTCYSAFDQINCLIYITWPIICPVVDINMTDADHCSQVHPPRRFLCALICCHTLTTRCSAVCIKSVYCFVPSPALFIIHVHILTPMYYLLLYNPC